MGQHYYPVLGDLHGTNVKVFDLSVDEQYTLSKLMEHSWWDNSFCNSFAKRLHNHKGRVIWCGCYTDDPNDFAFEINSASYTPYYGEIWGESIKRIGSKSTDFSLDNKFLLNHDTRQFIDLNEYKQNSHNKYGWIINPLPLLTAIGNGRGGGDFPTNNVGAEFVGIWAWHLLSISDKHPKSYKKFNLIFKEIR